jgi:hypothetical protein
MYQIIKIPVFIIILFCCFSSCHEKEAVSKADFVIAKGQMPNITTDKSGTIHLVYGLGDSIMYTFSKDKGNSFSSPSLIAVLPQLYSFAMRGPQIAATSDGVIVTACTEKGNIYSFYKENGSWKQAARINDVDTVAKEGLMALSADGENAFAVWLDLRGNKRNKIYGARSTDAGRTWSKNIIIYISPDTGVCPCCKPSVVMENKKVDVMFRNWLNGSRDLYLIKSTDGGSSFGQAEKLGSGTWKLNGCPMDGGGLAINKNGKVQTVWKREGNIFTAIPGVPEIEIGKGHACSIETINNKNIYTWIENDQVVCMKSGKEKKILGKGTQPVLKALDEDHAICIWENEKQIHGSVVAL